MATGIEKDNYYPDFRWLNFAAERSYQTGGIAVYGFIKTPNGIESRIDALHYVKHEDHMNAVWHPPAFWLTKEHAQEFMDDLWNCGIRPTDMGEAVGALPATQAHLKDMQKVFDKYILGDE